MTQVAIVGDGQLARGVAHALASRPDLTVLPPAPRALQDAALRSGADVVVIATTTRLADVTDAIRTAVEHGSNVLVSAEESSFPWVVDANTARDLDALARGASVSILGCGLNPGFVFDALVLTLLGTVTVARRIEVTRTVDLSGFGEVVAARLGLGVTAREFDERVATGEILGHAGFSQSISLVADRQGISLERIDTTLRPIMGGDTSVGVDQEYVGIVDGEPWFRATFIGHVAPAAAGLDPQDHIVIDSISGTLSCVLDPGIGSQSGSQAIIANSVDRIIAARPGWITVADLPPAYPVTPRQLIHR